MNALTVTLLASSTMGSFVVQPQEQTRLSAAQSVALGMALSLEETERRQELLTLMQGSTAPRKAVMLSAYFERFPEQALQVAELAGMTADSLSTWGAGKQLWFPFASHKNLVGRLQRPSRRSFRV